MAVGSWKFCSTINKTGSFSEPSLVHIAGPEPGMGALRGCSHAGPGPNVWLCAM